MGTISQIGLTALQAYQRAMATVSNNIANVNTPGYSVEQANFVALPNRNGVDVQSITRMFSAINNQNLRDATSSFQRADTLYNNASYLEGVVVNDPLNINTSLSQIQAALNAINTNPTSTTNRTNFIAQLNQLTTNLNTIGSQLQSQFQATSQQLSLTVNQANTITQNIASLNGMIASATGDNKLTLEDQRDQLIVSLSQLTNVTTQDAGNGVVNVSLSNGQSLVNNNQSTALAVNTNPNNPTELDIVVAGSTGSLNSQIGGGQLKGLLDYVGSVINPAMNQIGLLSVGISSAYNTQNKAGYDLNGNAGGNLFNDLATIAPTVTAGQNNTGSAVFTTQITSVNSAVPSDYQLGYDGTNYKLTRLSDNSVVYTGTSSSISVDGLSISATGAANAGDTFLISPYRNAAQRINVQVTDPSAIAVSSDPAQPGNNSNGLVMAQLQNQPLFANGTKTMSDQYTIFSQGISNQVSAAKSSQTVNQAILTQAQTTQSNYSGVNLDEEAAKMMQYQQAYQAASVVIAVENKMFDSILTAVGG